MTEETLRGFHITKHFLKFEEGAWNNNDEYRVPWNETNVKWKIRKVQSSRQLITNIQYDDSPHAPDLFLYTNITENEDTNAYRVAEDNVEALNFNRSWYVKQIVKKKDRIGLRHFTTLPIGVFRDYWRKPISTTNLEIGVVGRGLSSVRIKLMSPPHYNFRAYLDFPELNTIDHDYTMSWFKENCHDGIYLFSDYGSMFVDPDDEFGYIASCVGRTEL